MSTALMSMSSYCLNLVFYHHMNKEEEEGDVHCLMNEEGNIHLLVVSFMCHNESSVPMNK